MKARRGFTLIELMIVVLVIAVLAGIALSGYQKQMRKSRRAEAKQALSDISLRQEKFRTNNTAYAACDALLAVNGSTCAGFNTTLTYYSVAITFPASGNCPGGAAKGSANSFIVTATPKAGTDQANDTCATVVLTNDCGTVVKSGTGSDAANCW